MPRHLFLVSLLLAALAAAPARGQATGPAPSAQAVETALDSGDRDLAQRLLIDAIRQHPDALDLRLLKLRFVLEGEEASFLERGQISDAGREVLRLDADNAVAHTALGTVALSTFLFFQNKSDIKFGYESSGQIYKPADHTPEFLSARFGVSGRFDIDLVREVFGSTDASGPASGAARDARHHLEAAVAAEPQAFSAYTPLATLFVAEQRWDDLARLTRGLDAAAVRAPEAAWSFPLWSAVAAYRRGETERAAQSVARALEAMTPEESARLEDLTPLLTPEETEAYRSDPAGFATAYWLRQDTRLLTFENERRLEHAARFAEATLLFGWKDLRGTETDRGQIWLRYGSPDERVLFSSVIYPGDGYGGFPELYEVWEYPDFRYVFRDPIHSGEFGTYSPAASAYANVRVAAQAERDDYVTLDRQRRRETPQASQYAPRQRLDLPFLASAFRGERGGTDLVVAYGVPLASAPEGRQVPLSLRSGTFLLGAEQAWPLAERRREYSSLPSAQAVALPGATVWVGVETFTGAQSAQTVAVETEAAGGAAVGIARGSVPVLEAGAPGLSDVLLASYVEEGGSGPLVRRGFAIRPLPVAAASGADPIYIYFETYGLETGASGRTDFEIEAALVPVDERSGLRRTWDALRGKQPERGTAVGVEGQGSGPDEGRYLILDASDLRPGSYTLVLTVRDRRSGAEASRERSLLIE